MRPRLSLAGKRHFANGRNRAENLIESNYSYRHAWISYLVDAPPTADKILQTGIRSWELPDHRPNLTLSRAAFKTYST